MAKNGKPYLTLKLMDRSGEVEGRLWDRVDELSPLFDKGRFYPGSGQGQCLSRQDAADRPAVEKSR